jgi:hypothetical protein
MENQLFNLEKIREFTSPIENLQGKVNQITNIAEKLEAEKRLTSQYFDDESFSNQLNELTKVLSTIYKNLENISNNNINRFLDLQNKLLNKYKNDFKDHLKLISLNEINTKIIGLDLIENRKISKIISQTSYISSIGINQWLELIDALNRNSLFLTSVEQLRKYNNKLIDKRLKDELSRIPDGIDSSFIKEFEKQFYLNPELTYEEFLQTVENKLTKQELLDRKEFVNKRKEKSEIEELKKNQEEQTETYKNYLKFSPKEFERRMRKEKREKLTDVIVDGNQKKMELSDEVSEKIEKFKLQFDKNFKENYLNQKDDDRDPIELIRERKKKKEKEYKKFKNHFESG